MKVKSKGDVIRVIVEADDVGYDRSLAGQTLLKLIDNGNGWTAKFPSFSSTYPIRYMNIDYDEMALLVKAAEAMEDGE